MKKLAILAALALATVAFAATQYSRMFNMQVLGRTLLGTTTETSNVITRSLGGSAVIDFVAGTIVCTDSAAITVTGALVGDSCFVGTPAAAAINSTFSCYVSAADAVKVRHCPAGTAIDPASGTYYVRVFSAQ